MYFINIRIFFNNCFKNGILPVVLPKEQVDNLMDVAKSGQQISVDLGTQKIVAGNHQFSFDVEPFRKHCLMNGLDDIGLTLEKLPNIADYEKTQKARTPRGRDGGLLQSVGWHVQRVFVLMPVGTGPNFAVIRHVCHDTPRTVKDLTWRGFARPKAEPV